MTKEQALRILDGHKDARRFAAHYLREDRPYTRHQILYVLTRVDVELVARGMGIKHLDDYAYDRAEAAIESFFGEHWVEVIKIGLEEWRRSGD